MKQAALALVLTLAAATAAQAQKPPKKKVVTPPDTMAKLVAQKVAAMKSMTSLPPLKEMRPGLEAKAKIKVDLATATGLVTVPNGSLQSRTIEERGGRLIYAFRIQAADKKVRDVMVDAMTGKVLPLPRRRPKKKKG